MEDAVRGPFGSMPLAKASCYGGRLSSDDGREEILNPDQHIATLTGSNDLKMTMVVKAGKGYSLAE
jgi:DNA-directed RNA polymerase alpha subunit